MRLTAILVSYSAILGGLLQAASAAAGPRVMLGNEVLAAGGFRELAGKRVGLITNPSGVNRDLQTTIEVLRSAPEVKLVALFGPEHGIYGDVPAGDKVESRTDPRTGLPWVPASPHVPHGESPLFQVATGMLGEIGGVSIGVGYTLPFQTVAAPKVNPHALAAKLNGYGLPGVFFRPLTYKPYYATFKDEIVGGVQLHFTDPAGAPLTAINYYALEALQQVAGIDVFAEAARANRKFDMFDKVNGTEATRLALQAGRSAAEIVAGWRAGEEMFRRERERYLLY